ncbi:MAG: hypothetical protein ACP5M4_03465 [Acidobacteriaceae bacterium]
MNFAFPSRIPAVLALFTLCALPVTPARAQSSPQPAAPPQKQAAPAKKPDTLITPQQAKELFASIDQILQFDSHDSGLPIEHPVKRQLTSRADVQKYLESQLKNGKSAKRMLRSGIVLKKFGLLPQNFDLGPFMVKLLKEQIAGYYDSKTKTVYLLNWVAPDVQKPVMAHELMHALQDQHVNLQKWGDKSLDGISHNVRQDNAHIRTDEDDTARQAVLEGQAMVTYIDYALRPHHVTIADNPAFMLAHLGDITSGSTNSPVMDSAPRVLRESLVFPYDQGLRFEIELIRDLGIHGAFAGALDNPPSTSYQIMNPRAYEDHTPMPILTMPNIHPLLDHDYKPYDIGVMGDLDAKMLLQLSTSTKQATQIASQWDGGIYYVAQQKHAIDPKSTASVALLYLSRWKTPATAQLFAKNYELEIAKQYPGAKLQPASTPGDRIYSTSQGPVLITITNRYVFVSESFPLPIARKLNLMLLNAQNAFTGQETAAYHPAYPDLTSGIRNFTTQAGFLRCELPIAARAAHMETRHLY